jgi:bacteriorhodopsin
MVLEFPLLLALSKKSNGLFWKLGFISLAMLVTAWIAETSEVGGGSWWGFYIVSCAFWVAIVVTLYGQVSQAAEKFSDEFKGYLNVMKKFIAIGWIIYPIGFLLALTGNESIREIAYNIADIINKVGFGVASVMAAQVLSKMNAEERLP